MQPAGPLLQLLVHPSGSTTLYNVVLRYRNGSYDQVADPSRPVADPLRWHYADLDSALTAAVRVQRVHGNTMAIDVYNVDWFIGHCLGRAPQPVERRAPIAAVDVAA